ncbi:hypothetical protein [Novosphingobium cyanobacteriorum]|uniref:Elongation factor P n=1 Tax=Novosphingobium cyanobacteriorum TaxID=3024215 RepID=A0ABT6CNU1_9SPHN|nr:hypothetical protein [Novosphingobium cyanobacteriorum]MDF8333977.1 hypothetical protein [Novosphingobium cyanobacteriorum]
MERALPLIGEARPLAAAADCFKSRQRVTAIPVMKRAILLASLALAAALPTAPAQAVPGGQLRVLIQGPWRCELPGDATAMPVAQPAENFRVAPDSSYVVKGVGAGNYLRLGDRLTMTSGPFEGRRYAVDSEAMLHRLDETGNPTQLRCVRTGSITAMAESVVR